MYQRNGWHNKEISVSGIFRDLRAQYLGSEKKMFDRENYFFRLYRPISFYPTAFFLRLGISANAVTGLGAICLLTAFALLAQGHLLSGALLYLTAYILDFVDGNIARYVSKPNRFGKMIDGLVDSLTFLLFIALAAGNFAAGHAFWDPSTEMALGVTTAFMFLLRTYFYLRVALIFATAQNLNLEVTPDNVFSPRNRPATLQIGKQICYGIISGMPLLLVISVLFNVVSAYLLGYFLLFSLATLFEVFYGLRRVWLADVQSIPGRIG